jgi:23S rRNA (adenine2030-N6)-methyltransferase
VNYRHAYHAGNFADVLKHAVLTRAIEYLKRKETPFRVVDTHAGCGRYALHSIQAAKTGEWRGGIGRLLGAGANPLPEEPARLLAPYLDAVRVDNAPGDLQFYPGSPLLAHRLMRARDTLVANELHPQDLELLEAVLGRERNVKLMGLDGWVALKALLPPRERRGIVLMDPPFEAEGEFERLTEGLAQGLRRFRGGIYLLWYPIKDPAPVLRWHKALAAADGPELLLVELMIRGGSAPDRLNGCGLVVANPPFALREELAAILPELTRRLAEGGGAHHRLEQLAAHRGGGAGRPDAPHRAKRAKP